MRDKRSFHIYRNIENTGLEDLCSFNEDTVYYETGFVKEPFSYGESLSVNFNPFDIKMWDAGGFLDAGRVEAWEKNIYVELCQLIKRFNRVHVTLE